MSEPVYMELPPQFEMNDLAILYLRLRDTSIYKAVHLSKFGEVFESEMKSFLGTAGSGLESIVENVPKVKSFGERGKLFCPLPYDQKKYLLARFEITGGKNPHISVRSSVRYSKREKKRCRPLYKGTIPLSTFDKFERHFKRAVEQIARVHFQMV